MIHGVGRLLLFVLRAGVGRRFGILFEPLLIINADLRGFLFLSLTPFLLVFLIVGHEVVILLLFFSLLVVF